MKAVTKKPVLGIKRLSFALAAAALAASLSACAGMGQAMSGKSGMTLYTFDKDRPNSGTSACYGECAAKWPPVPVSEASGKEFGAISRDDGFRQLTYEGHPLYYFAGDRQPGDRNGDGLGGVWHVVVEEGYDSYESSFGGAGGGAGGY